MLKWLNNDNGQCNGRFSVKRRFTDFTLINVLTEPKIFLYGLIRETFARQKRWIIIHFQ